ncbi:hypothetical protein Q7M76_05125 [Candidatus Liberibacter asiaticus]|nr:hypothetical protein [Candidatus Liberibacter asiaticus]MCU7488400.1 hypothetical protein [Candidatus Liberibacter asiaticus]MCU7489432.1 hypothetical protein [Candidatus Liberibacter asiaticus]MDI1494508.1 hypothetical protein [Candidatus Liberibacter asiaticus]QLK10338.1 hypothetical protein FGD64_03345 [Candidatus Liberibacter asiaticus]QMV55097.1 hypothetical protein HUE70_05085 [Candidatus Liberibacter asiaticus]
MYRIDYPVSQVMEINQACAMATRKKNRDWQRIASIPVSILKDSHLLQAHTEGDDVWVNKWLNNRDNASWRTSEGYV